MRNTSSILSIDTQVKAYAIVRDLLLFIMYFPFVVKANDKHMSQSIDGAFAVRTEMRVHLMVMFYLRSKVTLLALLAVNPDLVCAFSLASYALSSVPHEVTSALTMEHMLALQPNCTA